MERMHLAGPTGSEESRELNWWSLFRRGGFKGLSLLLPEVSLSLLPLLQDGGFAECRLGPFLPRLYHSVLSD